MIISLRIIFPKQSVFNIFQRRTMSYDTIFGIFLEINQYWMVNILYQTHMNRQSKSLKPSNKLDKEQLLCGGEEKEWVNYQDGTPYQTEMVRCWYRIKIPDCKVAGLMGIRSTLMSMLATEAFKPPTLFILYFWWSFWKFFYINTSFDQNPRFSGENLRHSKLH